MPWIATENNPRNDKYLQSVVEQGTTHIRTESLRSSQVRGIGLSSSRCVDRATKREKNKHHECTTSKTESITFESALTQPFRDHSDPGPCRRKRWLPRVVAFTTREKEMTVCLPTFSIVRDLDCEFFPRLQARIETGRVSTSWGLMHTRLFEDTLCHGMKG